MIKKKKKKLNKLPFGLCKFISAGKDKPASSDNHRTMERKKITFFQRTLTRLKKVENKKDMGLKLVSKRMYCQSGVMYPYVPNLLLLFFTHS